MNSAPIGIFDSGLGGLTVARAIFERLPHESTVYFGDTARVPYGPKSPETVQRYSLEILHWLLSQGVKAVVIACNTSTAHALGALRDASPVPVVGVIEPGARAAIAGSRGKVGVIGTAGTIASGAYRRAIEARAPQLEVVQQACPLFVPLVEEGWFDHPAAQLIAADYLRPLRDASVDALVLGCTHYPLLKGAIAAEIPGVALVESAEAIAEEVAALFPGGPSDATHEFFVTDTPARFLRVARRFLGRDVESAEQIDIR